MIPLPDGFLIDTSVLRVFSSLGRLDLLSAWRPLVITPAILREHGRAPPEATKALDEALASGLIRLDTPDNSLAAQALAAANPRLSPVDAASIVHAQKRGYAVFVADVDYRLECARRRIPVAGVSAILLTLQRLKIASEAELRHLAARMETKGYYRFNADERRSLGIG